MQIAIFSRPRVSFLSQLIYSNILFDHYEKLYNVKSYITVYPFFKTPHVVQKEPTIIFLGHSI